MMWIFIINNFFINKYFIQCYKEIYGNKKIILNPRPGKLGLGSAYIDGLKRCNGNFVFLMDADMSHHPEHIPEFIK